MTRDQLISLKKSINNKNVYVRFPLDGDRSFSEDEITEKDIFPFCQSSDYAATKVTALVPKIVRDLSNSEIDFNKISIPLNFYIYINKDDLDLENCICRERARTLGDYVMLCYPTSEYMYSDEKNIGYVCEKAKTIAMPVSFSEFVVGLNKRGFEFEGIKNYADLKERSLNGEICEAMATVSFPEEKVYKK